MAEVQEQRPFTHGGAVAWAVGVTLAWGVVVQQVLLLRPGASRDLVLLVGTQLLVYVGACALFASRRPGRSFEELFALRRAPVLLVVVGVLLGLALHAPAEKLNSVIVGFFPLRSDVTNELSSRLVPRNTGHAAALLLVVAGLGPFVEELLYRGALFTALRASASASAASAAITTGLLFTLIHLEPRWWLPIFLLAGCLGFLRAKSGSLWPGVFLHGTFNGSTLVLSWLGERAEDVSVSTPVVIGSSVAAALLLVLTHHLAQRSPLAERARALDTARPTGNEILP